MEDIMNEAVPHYVERCGVILLVLPEYKAAIINIFLRFF
jgi:hypothetical protein